MYRRRLFTTAVIVVFADVVTKCLAVTFLEGQQTRHLIGSFLKLSFARNPGAAFSFATQSTLLFSAFAILVVAAIVWFAPKVAHPIWALAFGGVLGGACGNLIDRVFRAPGFLRGHVVDFIELPNYPLFNVADSAIVCSAIAIGYLSIRSIPLRSDETAGSSEGVERS